MNFINFESLRDKEVVRQELREVRNELLRKAETNANKRIEENIAKELRGETKWMLPALSKKLKKSTKKKKKKDTKKLKSSKKSKSKKKYDSESDSSSSEDSHKKLQKSKKKKSKKAKKRNSSSSSSSSNESDEWIEKPAENNLIEDNKNTMPLVRDEWMTSGNLFMKTYIKEKKDTKKNSFVEYDPATSTRELNPHWKSGGDGLPSFQKPSDNYSKPIINYLNKCESFGTGGWRKQQASISDNRNRGQDSSLKNIANLEVSQSNKQTVKNSQSSSPRSVSDSQSDDDEIEDFLTDQQMNELAAKIIKAEIMGNSDEIKNLKMNLEKAREVRAKIKETCKKDKFKAKKEKQSRQENEDDDVLLTVTDQQGNVRPFQGTSKEYEQNIHRKHKNRIETHVNKKRVRYFPDDDRYDINEMFTRERNIKGIDSDLQFAEIAGKSKNPNDDLEDIFADTIRKSQKDEAKKEREVAIREQERLQKILDDCNKCFNTPNMQQNLVVSMGSSVYVSLPSYEGLQPGHCLIIPMQHTTCSTRLDEDVWAEISEYRKALTRMFEQRKLDTIFFETARYLNRGRHMVIHCVPCKGEMAPFYFKKAILESEQEWSTNKQLISLKNKDLRKSIPKGLPYFWVHFGMDTGFAHVIEDQTRFPENYAQEIIGNMLQLNSRCWRKPRREENFKQKVKQFAEWFKPFDFTNYR